MTALVYPPSSRPTATLILAHGAGAGQQHPFMVTFARGLAQRGLEIVTFNFQYTEQGRRAPDRAPKLEACYRATVKTISSRPGVGMRPLLIGGKSMGGRIASQIAAAPSPGDLMATPAVWVSGLVLLGYPLHPPGRPNKRRDAHLPRITAPVLVVQGSRDTFGTESELHLVMARMPSATLHIVEEGDHSFNIVRKNAPSRDDTYAGVMNKIVRWTRNHVKGVARNPT